MEYNEVTRILEELELSGYLDKFKEHQISDKSFVLMSRDDLSEIVPVLVYRLQILSAIDVLKSGKQDSATFSQKSGDEYSILRASLLDAKEMEERGLRCSELLRKNGITETPRRRDVKKVPKLLQFNQDNVAIPKHVSSYLEQVQDVQQIGEDNQAILNCSNQLGESSQVIQIQVIQTPAADDNLSTNIYGFNIVDVLMADETVRGIILSKIPARDFILRADRQAIAGVLVNAIIRPSKAAMEQVAKHLVGRYPSFGDVRRPEKGYDMWFFHTPFAPAATGFLEERLKSQRKKLNKKAPIQAQKVVLFNEDSPSWNSDDD
ncbi:hypothetical protein Fcan01_26192, partial [Folsomia candida]